ncbi:hypothetical protein POM88_021038 [Heracleum sosnowskyi]|uniref:Uncharacterized protein n=1 Tax=Heracleum sosnowskyi TaxID=360622 RepID=A0AAD8IDR6_9APIA|nr:hypothetical protein POM88_021038 [Heracleum sosnowskyi]
MDTSESEHSDCEVDDDVDWKYSSLDVGDESGWAHAEAKGRRRKTKRKMSKPGRHSVAQSNSNYFDDPETMDTMPAVEQDKKLQKPLDVSCSCSKWSFYKTAKCECRVAGFGRGLLWFFIAKRLEEVHMCNKLANHMYELDLLTQGPEFENQQNLSENQQREGRNPAI